MITIRRGDRVTTGGLSSPDFVTGTVGGGVMRPLTGWPFGTAGAVTRFSAGLSLFSPVPPAPIAPGGIIGIPPMLVAPGPACVPPVGIDTDLAAAGVVGGEDVGVGVTQIASRDRAATAGAKALAGITAAGAAAETGFTAETVHQLLVGRQPRGAVALLQRTHQRLHSLHGLLRKLLERLHQSTDSAADPTRDARHHLLDHLCGLLPVRLRAHTVHLPRCIGILLEFARPQRAHPLIRRVFKSAGLHVAGNVGIARERRGRASNVGRRMVRWGNGRRPGT